ncbi:hypothetical protein ASF44_03390 [Pseudorhodoferax sp. Leaf274]|nr:hypothetical protein ASF44_03390 [Pseudorhodoferax sp. Leaf274]
MVLVAAGLLPMANAQALVITAGSPVTTVPAYVPAVLGAEQFLLPIEVREAANLQEWSFDLAFDPAVVQQVDLGGFYYGVYAAQFSTAQPELSSIVSSGLLLDGKLVGVAGFSGGISGDGLLAYIAFEFLAPGQDPGFEVGNVPQPIPEPGTVALMAVGLALLAGRRGPTHQPVKEAT